jgi:hypothetical protein
VRIARAAALSGTTGLMAAVGVVAAPGAANAAPTECEPGYVSTSFSSSSSGQEPIGSTSVTNVTGTTAPVSITSTVTRTDSASVTGSVSVESVLVPLKAEVSATAQSSLTVTSGATLGSMTLPAGGSATVVFGFEQVSFSGSQKTCQSNGQFGSPTYFDGQAPTGTYFAI